MENLKMPKDDQTKAAGMLFTDGFSILLLKRNDGDHVNTWGIPGGHAKEGETPIQNASREVQEEIGIQKIPGVNLEKIQSEDKNFTYTTFLFKVNKKFKVTLNKEHSDYMWAKISDLNEINLHPSLKKNLKNILKKIKSKSKKFLEWIELQIQIDSIN